MTQWVKPLEQKDVIHGGKSAHLKPLCIFESAAERFQSHRCDWSWAELVRKRDCIIWQACSKSADVGAALRSGWVKLNHCFFSHPSILFLNLNRAPWSCESIPADPSRPPVHCYTPIGVCFRTAAGHGSTGRKPKPAIKAETFFVIGYRHRKCPNPEDDPELPLIHPVA